MSETGAGAPRDGANGLTVAVISRHNVPNYGSVLQAYATERALEKLGFKPVTVDYVRSDETVAGSVARYSSGQSVARRIYRATAWRAVAQLGAWRFAAERKKLLHMSQRGDENSIWSALPDADVYLTGSDQVWNAMGDGDVDGTYFWSGLPTDTSSRIVSYAASFGGDEFPKGSESRIASWLARYDAISVREDSGTRLVGRCGLHATQVLDPTLLLDSHEWERLAEENPRRRKPYALVYNLHPDSDMLRYTTEKVRGSGLELVSLCPSFRRRIGRHVVLPSVGQFIALFGDAACVYTDSFHGTAFCINFRKPFVAVFPKENSARNASLLRLFELESRNWNFFEGDAWDDDIDWNAVHAILGKERRRSMAWLKSAVEGGSR